MCEILEKDPINKYQEKGLSLVEDLQSTLEHIIESERVRKLGFDYGLNRSYYDFHVKEFKETLQTLNRMAEEL